MAPQTVHADQSGRVLTVRLDNPPRNFMHMRMVGELEQLVHDLEGDRSIGAVVITGAVEGVFITHFDVNEIRRSSERVAASVSSAQAGGTLRAVGAVQRIPGARSIVGRSPVGREFEELLRVTVNQVPFQNISQPMADGIININVRGDKQAAGGEHVVKEVH